MNIKNKYCLLSSLNQDQIDKLMELMPEHDYYFDFNRGETRIGFDENGVSGTWDEPNAATITYKEMLSLLGAKEEEQLVPHVHQKEIIAWANGEEIETMTRKGVKWMVFKTPAWSLNQQYRVKPKLTPTQLRIQELTEELVKLKEQVDVEIGIDKVMGK
jgi:hypothetical protein